MGNLDIFLFVDSICSGLEEDDEGSSHGDPELASMADEGKMEKKKWGPSSCLVLSKGQMIF
ncbi:hypothetical protein U1Q18_015658 [Sarracenia purpurea var. burkii]